MPASSSQRSAVERRCSIYTRSMMRMRFGPCGSGRPAEDWSSFRLIHSGNLMLDDNVITSLETLNILNSLKY